MKFVFLCLMIAAIAASSDKHWGVDEEENVAVLTNDNFEEFLKSNKFAFVKFYAPWCGHCKSMAPAYSNLGKRMKVETDGVAVGKVDSTVHNDLGTKYGVQGFPTLKLFINGEPVDYAGGREEDAMFNWLKKKTGPSAVEITDHKALDEHAGKNLSVLFLHPEGDSEGLKAFSSLAANYDDVPFAHSSNQEYKTKYEVDQKYAFVVFRNFDDGRKFLVSNEVPTAANLKTFFETVRFPLVMDFDQKAAERIFGSEAPAIIFFSDDEKDSNLEHFKNAAEDRRGDILFAKSSVTGGLGARLCEFLGVTKEDTPTIRIIKFKNGALDKFKISDLTKEGITKALDEFKGDKLKAYYKSAPAPEKDDEHVKTIVGDNFEDVVINNENYVLLESYAPWCGHCKSLEPIYKELAEKLKNVKNLTIAKMDATANEHPSLTVKGFPTINFFKPGAKGSPEVYNGERTLEGFLKYLEEQTGKKLEDVQTTEL